ncbi:MAG: ATP-binding protein [Candidatus Aminicenantes bacterium]|nr:MAG: ATP-binding protein [Candidatus Aminicenantes bacterium]
MFVNRIEELNYLEKLNKERGARLYIIYGRRRIGKTELLRQFAKDKKHLFFSSDLSSEQEQLRQFTEKIYQLTKESFLETQSFNSWESLLRYLFDYLAEKASLIIIDEFPYLCVSNNALPSILQKVWDEKSKDVNIFLVICGSYMSFMEKEILGSKSPLFGRRTGQLVLQPMSFNNLEEFFPNYTEEKRVYSYAILGGTPAYLQRFSDKRTIERNVKTEILNKNSLLYIEPRFLLMEELREPSIYFSILKAIAFGKTRLNEIVQETGITDRHKVNKYLTVLRELHIIRREVPITEEKPHKSRKGIYLLDDPYFRFWFKYVFPNTSYLEEGDVDYVWEEKLKPDFDRFVGSIFEDICTQKIKKLNKDNQLLFKAKSIGRWWNGEDEIDIVAMNDKGSFLFCECKWTGKKVGLSIVSQLQNKAVKFPEGKYKCFGFFSKSGFTKELEELSKKREDIILFDY